MRAILQQHRLSWHMKVARHSFSGSIPSLSINYVAINKHLEKLRPQLSSPGLQWHRSCHSNEMTPLPILLQQWFSAREPYKIAHRSFFNFSNTVASMFVKFKQNLKSVIEIFCNEVFIIRNTVRKGKSWFLAIICRKRSAFDMQFHLIVVLIFLKTFVKDRGDSSAWLLESKEGFD